VLGPIARRLMGAPTAPDKGTAHPVTQPRPGEAPSTPTTGDTPPDSIWSGKLGDRPARWTSDDLRVGAGASTPTAFSALERTRTLVDQHEAYAPGTRATLDLRPRSAVGNLLSVEWRNTYMAPGAAHPDAESGYLTFDLAHPDHPVRLDALFDAPTVLQALLADPLIKQALAAGGVKTPPASLEALLGALDGKSGKFQGQAYSFGGDWLSHFAFHHIADKQAFVRIALPADSEQDRGGLAQLGLALPIPAALAAELAQADKERTLMTHFDKMAPGRFAHIAYTTGSRQAP
jgi:hypothetical protein